MIFMDTTGNSLSDYLPIERVFLLYRPPGENANDRVFIKLGLERELHPFPCAETGTMVTNGSAPKTSINTRFVGMVSGHN